MKIVEIKDEAFHVDDEVAEYIKELEGKLAEVMQPTTKLLILRARVSDLEAELEKHQWISVEDDKPKGDGQVWLAYGGYTYTGYYSDSYEQWYIFNYSGGFTKSEESPDHWKPITLPLPETVEI